MIKKEYILTNGNKFIRQNLDGRFEQVTNISLADTYNSQKAAKNIMLNSIPKSWSRNYYVAEMLDGEIIQCNSPRPQKAVRKNRPKSSYHFDNGFIDTKWCKGFVDLGEIFSEATKRSNVLAQELSDIDTVISDFEHYIEFSNLNARDGYKAYNMLRKFLRTRRQLKYEHKIVNAINNNQSAQKQINNIVDVIKACQNSEYKPRVLNDLFEVGIEGIESSMGDVI